MRLFNFPSKVFVLSAVVVAALIAPMTFAQHKDISPQAQKLLAAGDIGSDPIGLRVWTTKGEGQTFRSGESIVLNFATSRKAYVMALNVSPQGDVLVLFPSGESPDNLILPNKTYTLFGPESSISLTVSEQTKEATIVFYASSIPFSLAPLQAPPNQPLLKIPHTNAADMKILVGKLKELSQDKGFNREIVLLRPVGDTGTATVLMGGPKPPKSVKPGSLTGGQGLKEDTKKPDKE
ncbi:MAG: DUF4384 domain-containing protein [Thermodesulfobacteriota bacterium]